MKAQKEERRPLRCGRLILRRVGRGSFSLRLSKLPALREYVARDGERGDGARRLAIERLREFDGARKVFGGELGEDVVEVERLDAAARGVRAVARLKARAYARILARELLRGVRSLYDFEHHLPGARAVKLYHLRRDRDERAHTLGRGRVNVVARVGERLV